MARDAIVPSSAPTMPSTLLVDGGLGLAHMPMTIGEFRNARPELLAVAPVPDDATTWRQRKGAAFGEQHPPSVGGLFSVPLQAMSCSATRSGSSQEAGSSSPVAWAVIHAMVWNTVGR